MLDTLGVYVTVGQKKVMLRHSKVCEGKCSNDECSHRSHPWNHISKKKKATLIAGFKVKEDQEFKNVLQQKLMEAGVERYTHML